MFYLYLHNDLHRKIVKKSCFTRPYWLKSLNQKILYGTKHSKQNPIPNNIISVYKLHKGDHNGWNYTNKTKEQKHSNLNISMKSHNE